MIADSVPRSTTSGDEAVLRNDNTVAGAAVATRRNAPVAMLTYPYSGAERWWPLLNSHPELACTRGTGIFPLCEQAADTWRFTDGKPDGQLSPLAETSIRTLATTIITSLLARTGKRRWCEFATATPSSAETFGRLYPGTRFACLHRACPDVIQAALRASPWGLSSPALAPFTAAYAESTVAALTAYWVARTQPLVEFENAHPDSCLRVRYEDFDTDPNADGLFVFLGLDNHDHRVTSPAWPGTADTTLASDVPRSPFPADQVPPSLLAQAGDLMKELGYPPLLP